MENVRTCGVSHNICEVVEDEKTLLTDSPFKDQGSGGDKLALLAVPWGGQQPEIGIQVEAPLRPTRLAGEVKMVAAHAIDFISATRRNESYLLTLL